MKINTNDMRHKILRIVAECPNAANDDRYLTALVWMDEGWNYKKSLFHNLDHVSSAETIRRTRQKLVQEGLVKPSKATTEARYKDFIEARESL